MTPKRATRQAAEVLLRRALGHDRAAFRDGQWEAIGAIVNGKKKLLVVQRTGWGKSSVYFIATKLLRDQGAGPTAGRYWKKTSALPGRPGQRRPCFQGWRSAETATHLRNTGPSPSATCTRSWR